jgi:hypothetical protein
MLGFDNMLIEHAHVARRDGAHGQFLMALEGRVCGRGMWCPAVHSVLSSGAFSALATSYAPGTRPHGSASTSTSHRRPSASMSVKRRTARLPSPSPACGKQIRGIWLNAEPDQSAHNGIHESATKGQPLHCRPGYQPSTCAHAATPRAPTRATWGAPPWRRSRSLAADPIGRCG